MVFNEADKHDKEWLPIILLPIVMFTTRLMISSDSIARYISDAVAFAIVTTAIYLLRNRTERKAKGLIPGFVFYAYYPLHLLVIGLVK